MTSKVPPVPPANQTTKGTGDRKEVEETGFRASNSRIMRQIGSTMMPRNEDPRRRIEWD